MAFNSGAFVAQISKMENNPPSNRFQFASDWANCFMAGYGVPTPPSVSANGAKAILQGMFMLAYQDEDNGQDLMNKGVSLFAATLAVGMLPLWAAKPPLNYAGFSQVTNMDNLGTFGPALAAVTTPWFMSGTATQTVSGATTTWL